MASLKLRKIHELDNVAVAMEAIAAGEVVQCGDVGIRALDPIPAGHKMMLNDVLEGAEIVKYGHPIGYSTSPIRTGQWVHIHNVKTRLKGKITYRFAPTQMAIRAVPRHVPDHFDGYLRENGDVGIRNEIWILNTVGCVNKTAEQIAKIADQKFGGDGIDGVYHFAHPYGCSQLGDDLQYTQKILASLARNPNAAGVLILGLGCENNRIEELRPYLSGEVDQKIRYLGIQSVADEFEESMKLIEELVEYARTFQRQSVPVSKLRIGLKCGGSDGFSGITANPLVGVVSDMIIANGGTSILTEVPEMFGAETILMNRARDEQVFADVVRLIDDFKDYYTRHGQVIYENPSPGNKDGGITTLEEKSLGCIQKGGSSSVVGVLPYGASVHEHGLNLVQSPGNDMVSVTALAGAGAQMILFTTGRGTPMGGPVPTVKIASNRQLAERKKNWIDFDAGDLAEGSDMEELAGQLYTDIIAIASGRAKTKNEQNGFREIAIFKDGVTL